MTFLYFLTVDIRNHSCRSLNPIFFVTSEASLCLVPLQPKRTAVLFRKQVLTFFFLNPDINQNVV